MKLNTWLLLSLLGCSVIAAEIPPLVLPEGVGVNIHFVTGQQQDLDRIQAAGFKFIRMDFGWTDTERTKGQYSWSGYEELLGNLEQRGLRPIFILDYSNPLYEQTVTSPHPITHETHQTTGSPQHPESIAAFARWAAAAAKHFHGRHILWEIWNEPNGNFWSPKPDAVQYSALALATCKAIRQAEPSATIIGPASSGFPWEYLETFLKSGVLEYLDAVSVHPYRDARRPPETAVADYQKLREMIAHNAPPEKKNLPILSGEWGYSTHRKGVSLETQAAFAARQQLSNLLAGVPVSIWYDWKNDGPDPNENEHNFGTVFPDLSPKPAYVAIQTLTHQLNGYRLLRRLPLANEKDYAVLWTASERPQKLAVWTLDQPHTITLPLPAPARPSVITSTGESIPLEINGGQLKVELTAAPRYIALGEVK
jgi:polysaccharide biosynthesis protein PslG